MKRTILIYGLSPMELLKLLPLCKEAGINCRPVKSSETALKVSELLAGKSASGEAPVPVIGKFALLDGFAGHIDDAASIINQVSSGVIKAMHTPHNTNWRFADLCFAIQQEQNALEAFKKNRKV